MQIEKPYNINSPTNISDSNFPLERTQLKYQSSKEMITIPLRLGGIQKQNLLRVSH